MLVHDRWRDFQYHGSNNKEESHLPTRVLQETAGVFKGFNAEWNEWTVWKSYGQLRE